MRHLDEERIARAVITIIILFLIIVAVWAISFNANQPIVYHQYRIVYFVAPNDESNVQIITYYRCVGVTQEGFGGTAGIDVECWNVGDALYDPVFQVVVEEFEEIK